MYVYLSFLNTRFLTLWLKTETPNQESTNNQHKWNKQHNTVPSTNPSLFLPKTRYPLCGGWAVGFGAPWPCPVIASNCWPQLRCKCSVSQTVRLASQRWLPSSGQDGVDRDNGLWLWVSRKKKPMHAVTFRSTMSEEESLSKGVIHRCSLLLASSSSQKQALEDSRCYWGQASAQDLPGGAPRFSASNCGCNTITSLRVCTAPVLFPTCSLWCSTISYPAEHIKNIGRHAGQGPVLPIAGCWCPQAAHRFCWADIAVAATQYPAQQLDPALSGSGIGDKVDGHAATAQSKA